MVRCGSMCLASWARMVLPLLLCRPSGTTALTRLRLHSLWLGAAAACAAPATQAAATCAPLLLPRKPDPPVAGLFEQHVIMAEASWLRGSRRSRAGGPRAAAAAAAKPPAARPLLRHHRVVKPAALPVLAVAPALKESAGLGARAQRIALGGEADCGVACPRVGCAWRRRMSRQGLGRQEDVGVHGVCA